MAKRTLYTVDGAIYLDQNGRNCCPPLCDCLKACSPQIHFTHLTFKTNGWLRARIIGTVGQDFFNTVDSGMKDHLNSTTWGVGQATPQLISSQGRTDLGNGVIYEWARWYLCASNVRLPGDPVGSLGQNLPYSSPCDPKGGDGRLYMFVTKQDNDSQLPGAYGYTAWEVACNVRYGSPVIADCEKCLAFSVGQKVGQSFGTPDGATGLFAQWYGYFTEFTCCPLGGYYPGTIGVNGVGTPIPQSEIDAVKSQACSDPVEAGTCEAAQSATFGLLQLGTLKPILAITEEGYPGVWDGWYTYTNGRVDRPPPPFWFGGGRSGEGVFYLFPDQDTYTLSFVDGFPKYTPTGHQFTITPFINTRVCDYPTYRVEGWDRQVDPEFPICPSGYFPGVGTEDPPPA
jgi:hypothetical protein